MERVALVLQQLALKLTKWLLLLITLLGSKSVAAPLVPQFRSGTLTTSSTSESIINETITSHNYRTGYAYSASGHNIKTDTYINPSALPTSTQTINGINFNWTSPTLEAIPRWQIVNESQPFSLGESGISPGLETITTVTRQIQTTTTSESISVFGQ